MAMAQSVRVYFNSYLQLSPNTDFNRFSLSFLTFIELSNPSRARSLNFEIVGHLSSYLHLLSLLSLCKKSFGYLPTCRFFIFKQKYRFQTIDLYLRCCPGYKLNCEDTNLPRKLSLILVLFTGLLLPSFAFLLFIFSWTGTEDSLLALR